MLHLSGKTKRYIAGFFCAGFLTMLTQYAAPQVFPVYLLSSVLYGFIVITWAATVERRITQREMRRYLLRASLCMVILFLLRMAKYDFFAGLPDVTRLLWYGYYAPIIAVAVLSFQAALCIGRSPDWKPSGRLGALWMVSLVLMLTVLTNDLHRQVFAFEGPEETWSESYHYGIMFFVIYLWLFLLFGMTLLAVARRCRNAAGRKLLWVPLLPLVLELVFSVWLQMRAGVVPSFLDHKVVQFQEVFCFMVIAFWESCIQIGLVPCNSDYETIFDLSSIRAEIADEEHRPVLRSAKPLNLTKEQMILAEKDAVMLDEDHRVQGHPIRGGAVYWVDNISGIRAIHAALRETGERLSEEGTLIRAESRISEQKARAEVENRLYDSMNEQVRPQLVRIGELLSDGNQTEESFKRNLRECMVLCAYIKRRSNLMLIADRSEEISSEELYLSIRESLEYLKLTGVMAIAEQSGSRMWRAKDLLLAYDFLEEILEEVLWHVNALVVTIRNEECPGLLLELNLGGEEALRDVPCSAAIRAAGGHVRLYREDGTDYAEVTFAGKEVSP